MADVELLVNGRAYGGWKSARVTRSIEAATGKFALEVSDRWSGQDAPWPIREEDACELRLAGKVVVSGWVDRASVGYDAQGHTFAVEGRDRAGQLVDCSAEDTWEYLTAPLLTVARRLAGPHGVTVALDPLLGASLPAPAAKLTADPGDTAYEVLERACRLHGLLPVSDGAGGLLLTRAGASRALTHLVQGTNILSATSDRDASGRYYRYRVLGQHPGRDDWFGADGPGAVAAEARDENVRRTSRVLLVRPEGAVTQPYAKQRAEWEASVRAARAATVGVTVQGWTQGDGSLWPLNALVRVLSPFLELDGEMLITEAEYTLDESGTRTALGLRRPGAFQPEPVVRKNTDPWGLT